VQGGWAGFLDADASDEDGEEDEESEGFEPTESESGNDDSSESADEELIDEENESVRVPCPPAKLPPRFFARSEE
jgi:hypothetical protein